MSALPESDTKLPAESNRRTGTSLSLAPVPPCRFTLCALSSRLYADTFIARKERDMPGYIISNIEIFDTNAYGEYGALAPDAIKKYGGEFLTRGGATEIMEGDWQPHRIVMIKFDSVEDAKAMYNSPEYQAAKAKRKGAADFNMIIVEGI